MASSPIVIDYMQVTVTSSLSLKRFQRGLNGLYVLGYVQFSTNGYAEEPQFINFPKQMFFPKNRHFDTFSWQCKQGVTLNFKPVYGNLDVLNLEVIGEGINLAQGLAGGLRVTSPAGELGAIPEFIPLIP